MKKRTGRIVALVLVLAVVIAISWDLNRVRSFDFDKYREKVEMFSSDEVIADASTPRKVKKAAEKIWIQSFGKDAMKGEKPYLVSYDEEHKVWLVSGTLPPIPFMLGGTAKLLVEKETGKVLAVWHEK